MRMFIILLIITFIYSNTVAQYIEKETSVLQLKLKNDKLAVILDSFIANERLCNYYQSTLRIGIDLTSIDTGILIEISSNTDTSIYLSLGINSFFYYSNYLFFVSGDITQGKLFSICDKKKKMKYLERDIEYFLKHQIPILIDDKFSMWVYFLKDKDFILVSRHPFCE